LVVEKPAGVFVEVSIPDLDLSYMARSRSEAFRHIKAMVFERLAKQLLMGPNDSYDCVVFEWEQLPPELHASELVARAARQGLMARRPVFPPSELSSLSRKGSKGFAPGGA